MVSKTELLNGYVKADDKELVKLFLAECLKYDDINLPLITESTHNKWWYFAITDSMIPCGHGTSAVDDKKELTLDNFKPKPKTKVTYEFVTDLTHDEIAKAMIDGEVFYKKDGTMSYFWDGKGFFNNDGVRINLVGSFYRKVDWKNEALNYVDGCKQLKLHSSLKTIFTDSIQDTDMEFDREFLELCHLVAEITDKPE